LNEFFFPISETKLRPETRVSHGGMMRFLKSRHHSLNCVLQATILAGIDETRAENRTEGPLSKKQAASPQLISELLVCLERCFRVK